MKCAIVIATYSRADLFRRTLNCVANADYTGHEDIPLIISIDRAKNYAEMKQIADEFQWKHGEKHVILHEERQGLRKHFIFCGGLSQTYGPVIFLEDDVVVNQNFYQVAQRMTDYYINDPRLVGVSLYAMGFNETAQRPFIPLGDGSDVFFCSLMSWAPVYFPKQWADFQHWLDQRGDREVVYENVPQDVLRWPKSSFKKLHIQYVMQNQRYFAYARHSCATNFSEPGEHYKKDTNKLQVPMEVRSRKELNLVSLDDSLAVYDAFLELRPECLRKLQPALDGCAFDTDLYGKKAAVNLTQEYVLTTHKVKSSAMTWGRKMTPHEMNVISSIPGKEISLTRREDVKTGGKGLRRYTSDILYDIKGSTVLKVFLADLMWMFAFIKSRLKK